MSEQLKTNKNSLLKSYPKNIFCLESLWDDEVERKLSVLPLLELTSRINAIKHIHLSCNTVDEFKFNLKFLRRKKSYQIFYLAFHGSVENIHFADGNLLKLEDLAKIMRDDFKDTIVHFGSCGTLKTNNEKISDFLKATRIGMISGYTTNVDWAESAALDLLFFSALQNYKNIKYLVNYLEKTYPDLIKKTGFKVFSK